MEIRKKSSSRIILGGLLILFGFLVLLNNFDLININIGEYIIPSIILFAGIVHLANSTKKGFGAILIIIASGWFLSIFIPNVDFWDITFPIILCGIGILILVRNRKGDNSKISYFSSIKEEVNKDRIEDFELFGGSEKKIISDDFKGGSITALFGGCELDLTNSQLSVGDTILDVFVMFGGVELHVPKDWNVKVDVLSIFGGFSHKNKNINVAAIDNSRTLVITGFVMFGGGEIKSH